VKLFILVVSERQGHMYMSIQVWDGKLEAVSPPDQAFGHVNKRRHTPEELRKAYPVTAR
jgi:hypothetical protein